MTPSERVVADTERWAAKHRVTRASLASHFWDRLLIYGDADDRNADLLFELVQHFAESPY